MTADETKTISKGDRYEETLRQTKGDSSSEFMTEQVPKFQYFCLTLLIQFSYVVVGDLGSLSEFHPCHMCTTATSTIKRLPFHYAYFRKIPLKILNALHINAFLAVRKAEMPF